MKKLTSLLLICAILVCFGSPMCFAEKNNYREVLDEGFRYEEDGCTMVVRWCSDGEAQIFGRMWLPADFDENTQYPTIIMCHGHNGNSDFWDKYFAPYLAKAGYVCYAIDCRSSFDGKRDYSTPNEDHVATVNTYARDIIVATEFMRGMSFVDQSHLYLMGQSMGGMGVQTAASRIPDEVAGMILLYGFIGESVREMMDTYDEVMANPYANGEVLMLGGTLDGACSFDNIEQCMALYENSTMVLISGTRHGYGMVPDRASEITAQAIVDFLERVA